jgi:predicted peptidase
LNCWTRATLGWTFAIGTIALATARAQFPADGQRTGQEEVKSLHASVIREVKLRYLVQLPRGYQTEQDERWPLLVYLHGGSGRGSDIKRVKQYGPPVVAGENRDFPFVLASPQCPEGEIWSDTDALIAMIDAVQRDYRIDPRRIYLTGISMGGRGVLYLAYKYPGKFAAIEALAPYSPITAWGTQLASTPIRIIHGAKDTIAPLADSQELVKAIQQANGSVDLQVLPERDHFITDLYNGTEVYKWLLAHKR